MRRGTWWKALGLAAVVGVTASGVVIARSERRRRAYTPEQVRERLHARYQAGLHDADPGPRSSGASRPITP